MHQLITFTHQVVDVSATAVVFLSSRNDFCSPLSIRRTIRRRTEVVSRKATAVAETLTHYSVNVVISCNLLNSLLNIKLVFLLARRNHESPRNASRPRERIKPH